jgi:hypothetical protein
MQKLQNQTSRDPESKYFLLITISLSSSSTVRGEKLYLNAVSFKVPFSKIMAGEAHCGGAGGASGAEEG